MTEKVLDRFSELQASDVPRQGPRVQDIARLAAAKDDRARAEERLPPAAAPASPIRSMPFHPLSQQT